MLFSGGRRGVFAAGCVCALSAPGVLGATAFETYGRSYRVVQAPAPSDGSFSTAGDALADGRLIAMTGFSVYVETGVGAGQFALAATLDSSLFASAPDPAFIKVSPDGSRIAIGGGQDFSSGSTRPIVVFDSTVLNGGGVATLNASNASAFSVEHSEAAWADNTRLAVTAGAFGSPARVDLLDVTSSVSAPAITTAVSNIQGASGGIAFDALGRMYTGNGFALGTPGASDTGWVKVFEQSLWDGGGADFEADGTFLVDALSASGLSLDGEGNLFIGGGDFFGSGDGGYMGIASADAISEALLGLGGIDSDAIAEFRRLDPAGLSSSFYGTFVNAVTGELVVTDGATWYVTVPSPGGLSLAVGASMLARRRRRAA